MKAIGVIPARWGSTRFPGKVLAVIHGRPMIQYVWEQAQKAARLDEVIVACDDARVCRAVEGFGGRAVMTSPGHVSGTDRIAEAVGNSDADIVINIQGDEPLIEPTVIDQLVGALERDTESVMATVVRRITDDAMLDNPNVVKVVVDRHHQALYFSRAPIPYDRDGNHPVRGYQHLGLYGYRTSFLMGFRDLPASVLEQTERLEQLRVLEAGYRIVVVETAYETIGVDTPEDLERVARYLSRGEYGQTG